MMFQIKYFFLKIAIPLFLVGALLALSFFYSIFFVQAQTINTYIPNNGSFDVSGNTDNPRDLAFNASGTKLYVVNGAGLLNPGGVVYVYALTTPYDLTTASYSGNSFDVSNEESGPTAMTFGAGGTKFYVAGPGSDRVFAYTLSTAYDLNTASYSGNSVDISGQEGGVTGIAFNSSGTKSYLIGADGDRVYAYSLSNPYDLTTASYTGVSVDVSSQDTLPTGFAFNATGGKMFITGQNSDAVHAYNLSTPYDLTTISYTGNSLGVSNKSTGIIFNGNDTKLYVLDKTADAIFVYQNHNPQANLDTATTNQNTSVTVNVVSNDINLDNDTFHVSGVGHPPNGTASIVGTDSITYTPDTNFFGPDTFTYTVQDSIGNTDTATVSVTVFKDQTGPPGVGVIIRGGTTIRGGTVFR